MMSQSSHQGVMLKKELTKKLQARMYAHFFEHATLTVNDSLASILALCDIEQMKTIPKIKQYINNVNKTLNSLKVYYNENRFNINDVLKNVIGIIKDEFRDINIIKNISESYGYVESNQVQIENILLFLILELISSDSEGIYIYLHQKNEDAQILIKKNASSFSEEVLGEIELLKEGFKGKIYIEQKNNNISIDIRIPLSFNKPKEPRFSVNMPSIKVESIQPIGINKVAKI